MKWRKREAWWVVHDGETVMFFERKPTYHANPGIWHDGTCGHSRGAISCDVGVLSVLGLFPRIYQPTRIKIVSEVVKDDELAVAGPGAQGSSGASRTRGSRRLRAVPNRNGEGSHDRKPGVTLCKPGREVHTVHGQEDAD